MPVLERSCANEAPAPADGEGVRGARAGSERSGAQAFPRAQADVPPERTDDVALARRTLEGLSPGLHHARLGGLWVMVGRALPVPKVWASLPPAHSISVVWGGGGARIEHPGGVVELGPGHVMWIDAGCGHRGQGHVGSDFLTLFVPELPTRPRTPSVRVGPLDEALHGLLVRLAARVLERRDGDLAALRARLLGLVGALETTVPVAVAPRSAQRAKAALESKDDGGLIDLARRAGLSATYLSQLFTRVWGIPTSQYRKQLRLLSATRLLLDGRSVTEAAHEAGFADAAHLSRTFRDQYGISPSKWRKLMAG